MTRRLFALITFALLATAALGQTIYPNPGATVASFTDKITTGAGTIYVFPPNRDGKPYSFVTWGITLKTAAPGSHTTVLEGTNDQSSTCLTSLAAGTGTSCTWSTLDSSNTTAWTSDIVSGERRHVVNKPFNHLRCNITALVIGGSAGLTCKITAWVQ